MIVGDHNLIDVVVENDRLAVLTAKDKPGLTNIIVLDEDEESAAVWARRILPAKNTLDVADARLLEEEFEARLAKLAAQPAPTDTGGAETANQGEGTDVNQGRADNDEERAILISCELTQKLVPQHR